jgi:CubicO group peptidase (beta-lactamase class C family)
VRTTFLLAAILLAACSSNAREPARLGPAPPRPAPDDCLALQAAIETRLDEMLVDPGYPSIAVGVVRDGRPLYTVVRGVAERATRRPATASTVYQIGSITKMFVGLLAADLAASGAIDLDTPLAEVLGDVELSPVVGAVTLRQLATHTAGVPRYPDNLDRVDGEPMRGYSESEMRAALGDLRLELSPGAGWSYSNLGYGILAFALERATGRSLELLLRSRVFEPLELGSTSFAPTAEMRSSLAVPYRDDDPQIATEPWRMGSLAGAGGLYASLEDLLRFAAAEVSAPAVLRPAYARARRVHWRFESGNLGGYGLGRFVVDSRSIGARLVWHGGDIDGYAATLMAAPREGVAIVVLTNSGIGRPIGELGNWLMTLVVRSCAGSLRSSRR